MYDRALRALSPLCRSARVYMKRTAMATESHRMTKNYFEKHPERRR